MFLFNTEFSQGTVKLPAAAAYEDFWNIEPSGVQSRPDCVHIHRDKCEDKTQVLSGQLELYLHHFLLVSRVALRYGNMAPAPW